MAEVPTKDFLAELFLQFDQQEQARIKAAESDARRILAQGRAAVKDRLQAAGSEDLSAWALKPEDDARADAAGVVFIAYANAIWRQTDTANSEQILEFLAKVDKLIDPLLVKYGNAGEAVNTLRAMCRNNVQLVLRNNGSNELIVASERPNTVGADSPTNLKTFGILQYPERWDKRRRQNKDLQALYARHLGRNAPEFERQEELLKDAHAWAEARVGELLPAILDVFEMKRRLARQTYDTFVQTHRYREDLHLSYRDFESTLWEQGWPSIEDQAIVALAECKRLAANAQFGAEGAQETAVDRLDGVDYLPGNPIFENPFPDATDQRHALLVPYFDMVRDCRILASEYLSLSMEWEAASAKWSVWPPPQRVAGGIAGVSSSPGSDLHVQRTAAAAAAELLGYSGKGVEARRLLLNTARDRWLDLGEVNASDFWLYAIREFWLFAAEQVPFSGLDIEAFDKIAEVRGYSARNATAIGKRLWNTMVSQRKCLRQVVKEQQLSTGGELDQFEEPAGWIEDGSIAHCFEAFAYFAGVLASRRARELEESEKSPGEIIDKLPYFVKAPIFVYRYPDDFPESEQIKIENARGEANRQLEAKGVSSYAEDRVAREEWF